MKSKSGRVAFTALLAALALAHNAAQLCAAYFLTSTSVLFYVPFLLVFGVLTGLLTGLVLKLTLAPLERLQKYLGP